MGSICAGGSVYVLNTIYDRQSDEKNDKNLFLVKGIFQKKTLQSYAIFLAVVGLALLLWTFRKHFIAVFLGFLITGIFYNLPPLRLKDRVGTDVAAALLGGGLTYWCGLQLGVANQYSSILPYLLAFTGVSLWTQIPDIQGDKLSNKKTFAVYFGSRKTAIIGWILVLSTVITSFIVIEKRMLIASIITLLASIKLLWKDDVAWAGLSARIAIFILTLLVALEFKVYLVALVGYYFSARWYYLKRFGIRYPSLTGVNW